MNGWRGTWAAAQITGVIFSSLVWIVVCGLSLPVLAVTTAIGIALVIARNTWPLLWWRFGATSAAAFQRDTILTAIVPIPSLRGRRQPSIWVGRRIDGGLVVMPSRTVVVVSPEFVRRVSNGQLSDRQASAIISRALGHCQVHDSSLVNVVETYCAPWRFVQIFTRVAGQLTTRSPMLGLSWKIRWIVYGVAIVDSYRNARWAALVGVVVIAVLSWSTGHFQKTWARKLEDLSDDCAASEGLGPDLADLIERGGRSLVASERASRLRRTTPSGTDGGGPTPGAAPGLASHKGRLRNPALPMTNVHNALGRSAKGSRSLEAGVELLIRSSEGRFANPGQALGLSKATARLGGGPTSSR